MSYQSFLFIAFSLLIVLIYYISGKKGQKWVLAIANLAFYAISGVEYLPFLLVTMLTTFFVAKKIGLIYEKLDSELTLAKDTALKKELRNQAKAKAKKILGIGLFVAIAILVVCKYTSFMVGNINGILSLAGGPQIKMFKMILPVGISFYTFMALSYVLDIYWKRYKYEKSFLYYAIYLSYFPHVVQGPIDRFNEFKSQIEEGTSFSYDNLIFGAQLTLWGFFKKLVVADGIGQIINPVLKNWQNSNGLSIAVALILFSIQIYGDFSGCIDIVSGISEMFGIKLRKNFNHPYFSKTMPEFWRRWHITLQEWFKDYVYYPVSASAFTKKVKKALKSKDKKRAEELFTSCFPILVVWLITGIWHGASWNFVIWGLFHAAVLIGSQAFEPLFSKVNKKLHINTENRIWRLWQMVRTYLICCIGRIFFKAPTLSAGIGWIGKMFSPWSVTALFSDYKITGFRMFLTVVLIPLWSIMVLWAVDLLQEKTGGLRRVVAKKPLVLRWILIYALLFSILIFGCYGPGYDASDFIYEQF